MAADETSKVGDSRANVAQATTTDDYNPKLDFFSEHFDPLLALRTPNLVVPVPSAKTYDNIQKYKAVVEDHQPEKRERKSEKSKPPEPSLPIERRWLPHQLPIQAKKKAPKQNVFTRMESMVGPLQLLRTCKDTRQRIKVWTRHSHDIRGYCLAFVVAFDKHWNLALEDVDEVWTRPKKRKIPALGGVTGGIKPESRLLPPVVTVIQSTKKTETCSRHVAQLLVRGEHIAYIVVMPEENRV